jgi:hypothetical protein
MPLIFLHTAVVVVADQHNPTVLHPAFLQGPVGVVPADWQLSEEPICTPPISLVKYATGVNFTVETNKFQVLDERRGSADDSRAPDLAIKYIRALPHVRYTAVGINFLAVAPTENATRVIRDRFITSTAWTAAGIEPMGVGVKLAYAVSPAVFRLTLDPGEGRFADGRPPLEGVVASGNFHADAPGLDACAEAIGLFGKSLVTFQQTVGHLLGLDG